MLPRTVLRKGAAPSRCGAPGAAARSLQPYQKQRSSRCQLLGPGLPDLHATWLGRPRLLSQSGAQPLGRAGGARCLTLLPCRLRYCRGCKALTSSASSLKTRCDAGSADCSCRCKAVESWAYSSIRSANVIALSSTLAMLLLSLSEGREEVACFMT